VYKTGAGLRTVRYAVSFDKELLRKGMIDASELDRPDVALVENAEGRTAEPVRDFDLASKTELGETVFFSNYQPDQEGRSRDPEGPYTKEEAIHSQPALYAGVVVEHVTPTMDLIATNLKSYGAIADTKADHGASGGPVFNEQGELVGLSTIIVLPPKEGFSVALKVKPKSRALQFVAIQRITPKFVQNLRTRLKSAKYCE
jgi:hypothetical protein